MENSINAFDYIKNKLESEEVSNSIFSVDKYEQQMLEEFEVGKPIGTTTHFEEFDSLMRIKHGKLYIATGYPNHGKTEFTLQLCLLQAMFEDKKVAVYSPEAEPIEVFDTLIQTYIGKPLINYNHKKMTKEEYQQGLNFIKRHFFIVQPENESLDNLIKCFEKCEEVHGTSVVLIDPYNEIDLPAESISERTRKIAKEIKKQTKKHNWLTFLVVHPTGESRDKNGKRVIPTIFNLEGGRMLGNKADVVFTVDRPFKDDPADLTTRINISKIKNQKLMGVGGSIDFTFNREQNRYYLNGKNKITETFGVKEAKPINTSYNPNKFTEFNKDIDPTW